MSDTREASRALDAEIATRVMGYKLASPIDNACDWSVGRNRDGSDARRNYVTAGEDGEPEVLPNYSTQIDDAFEVVDAMRAKGCCEISVSVQGDGTCEVEIGVNQTGYEAGLRAAVADAATPALAICLASLAALATASPEKAAVESAASLSSEGDTK